MNLRVIDFVSPSIQSTNPEILIFPKEFSGQILLLGYQVKLNLHSLDNVKRYR